MLHTHIYMIWLTESVDVCITRSSQWHSCQIKLQNNHKAWTAEGLSMLWAAVHVTSHIRSSRVTWIQSSEHRVKRRRAADSRAEERIMESERRNEPNASVSPVIYRRVQAQCRCDQSGRADKMQVMKLLWNPVRSNQINGIFTTTTHV